jgi:hypothetical protein
MTKLPPAMLTKPAQLSVPSGMPEYAVHNFGDASSAAQGAAQAAATQSKAMENRIELLS